MRPQASAPMQSALAARAAMSSRSRANSMSPAPMDDERVAADGIAGHRRRARGLPGLVVAATGQSGCVLPLSRRGGLRSGRASLRRRE